MTLKPPIPVCMEGWRESGGKRSSPPPIFICSCQWHLEEGRFGGVGGCACCNAKLKWGRRNVEQKSQTKKEVGCKTENMEAETRPQSETHQVISVPNCSSKKLFSSLAFLSKRGDFTAALCHHRRHPPPPRCSEQIRFPVHFMESPHARKCILTLSLQETKEKKRQATPTAVVCRGKNQISDFAD